MKQKYALSVFFLIFFIILTIRGICQTDTEFWFAAPDVSSNGSANFDIPIYFRISTLNQASVVTISQPANASFTPIIVNLPSNSSSSVDLSAFLSTVECAPPNTVLNYGFKISATALISCYYEVASTYCYCNPEIFEMNGKNALGTLFYTPFQTFTDNSPSYNPLPYSSFEIVATEDNTTVNITPTHDVVGHVAGVAYNIMLNKGQAYTARAVSQAANQHPAGSKVMSDKPVAVTVCDDLMAGTFWGGCADLGGDQIVPVDIIGTQYIVMKGMLNNNIEKAFVLATQDNTSIFINGGSVPIATINTGATYTLDITAASTYVVTSNPAYVLHLSGFGCELGYSLLPSIECTGSYQIGFTRSVDEPFYMNLMTKNGFQGDFILNGSSTLVPASAFTVVPGTSNQWVTAQLLFSTAQISVGTGSLIRNTGGLFHMGVIHGTSSGGCRYGYFSDFSSLNLGPDHTICQGDTVILDAGIGKDSYLWNNGATTQTIAVSTGGTFSVQAVAGSCTLTDSVVITLAGATPFVNLGPADTTLCTNATISYDLSYNQNCSFHWTANISTGNTVSSLPTMLVDKPGTFSVTVTQASCGTATDQIVVHYNNVVADLGNDITSGLCLGTGSQVLDATYVNTIYGTTNYHWSTGQFTPAITVTQNGIYSVTVSLGQCSDVDTVQVHFDTPVIVILPTDTAICAGSVLVLNAGNPGAAYHWSTGLNTQAITVTNPGTYTVTVSNACGQVSSQVTVNQISTPVVDLGPDQTICSGNMVVLTAGNSSQNYHWSTGSDAPAISVTSSGNYVVTVTNQCGSVLVLDAGYPGASYNWSTGATTQSIVVNEPDIYSVDVTNACGTYTDMISLGLIQMSVNLGPDTTICEGSHLTLDAGNPGSYYYWSTNSFTQTIDVYMPGEYDVAVTSLCGTVWDTIVVNVFDNNLNLGNDTTLCEGASLVLDAGHPGSQYIWSTGASSQSIGINEAGTYSVSVTNYCGNLSDIILISELPSPVVDFAGDTIWIQPQENVMLDAGYGNVSYYWSTGATTQTITTHDQGYYYVTVTAANGCQTAAKVYVAVKTGIQSVDSPTSVVIFPDPAKDKFQVSSKNIKIGKIELFDCLGQMLIFATPGQEIATLNTTNLPNGVYILKIVLVNGQLFVRPVCLNK
ncbi:MAG: T9SS type A sorting domain-containing protein [Bacteroidia bacterium]|nr:T9SS type A sorting domain-containing protein [Bacteroidia bacterium]